MVLVILRQVRVAQVKDECVKMRRVPQLTEWMKAEGQD